MRRHGVLQIYDTVQPFRGNGAGAYVVTFLMARLPVAVWQPDRGDPPGQRRMHGGCPGGGGVASGVAFAACPWRYRHEDGGNPGERQIRSATVARLKLFFVPLKRPRERVRGCCGGVFTELNLWCCFSCSLLCM